MATQSGVNVFNYVRQNASGTFREIVPSATENNINELSNILFNDAYQPQLNEFVTTLINRIGLTIIRNKTYSNPLSILKKGAVPLGTDIQDIYTNPAEAQQYEYSNEAMAKLLTINDPDTHVAYYRRNRQDKYTKTITREGLQGAFTDWDKFNDYIAGITQSLYSGNYIDEFKYTKQLIDSAYDNDKVIMAEVTNPTDEASSKAFVKEARKLYKKLSFPSTEWNAYSKFTDSDKKITTWTEPDRLIFVTTADVMANVDVETLAGAFNMEKANFLGRVLEVDSFQNPEILGLICDEAWFQIYDNIFRFDEFYNANVMAWNEYLHVWQTFAICPFANAVLLTTDSNVVPVEGITISDVELELGTDSTISVTLSPETATSDIDYSSLDESVFTVTKLSNTSVKLSPVAVGKSKLVAVADNGVTTQVDVTVTEASENP